MKEFIYKLNSILGEFELTHNPIGWDNAENTLTRSKEFEGIFNNYSQNALTFHGNGYDYLKELRRIQGIQIDCTFQQLKYNVLTKTYSILYTGILNGRTYKEIDLYGGAISMNIGETSFTETVLARIENTINYDDTTGIDGNILTVPADLYRDVELLGMEALTSGSGELENGGPFYAYFSGVHEAMLIPSLYSTANNPNIYSPNFFAFKQSQMNQIGSGGWLFESKNTTTINIKLVSSAV